MKFTLNNNCTHSQKEKKYGQAGVRRLVDASYKGKRVKLKKGPRGIETYIPIYGVDIKRESTMRARCKYLG